MEQNQKEIAACFSEPFTVRGYECDANSSMTPGAVLRHSQQISTDQCLLLGIDDDAYSRTHTAFLLAKMTVEFYAPLREGMRVTASTQPRTAQRAVYVRYNSFRDEAGTLLAAVDSRWVLVDTETRRILRHRPEAFPDVFLPQEVPQLDITVHKCPAQPCGEQTAVYTRCDSNGHLNNTVYADIVCDALDVHTLLRRGVRRFAIDYRSEVPLGGSFALSRGAVSPDSWYFCGQSDGTTHFEAEITLGPDAAQ